MSTFYLPASDIPSTVRSELDPWVAGFVGLDTEQAGQRLRERWSAIQRPSLIGLRDTLLEFEVEGIAKIHSGFAIKAYRDGADDPGIGDYWYLAGPMEREEIARRLIPFGLEGNEALADFLFFFGGLAEDTETAGHFVSEAYDWRAFDHTGLPDINLQATQGFEEWKGALMLYHARNGCHILVRRDGSVGWWVMQERKVATAAEDFDAFVRIFDEHRQISWPFDPYGP